MPICLDLFPKITYFKSSINVYQFPSKTDTILNVEKPKKVKSLKFRVGFHVTQVCLLSFKRLIAPSGAKVYILIFMFISYLFFF